MLSETLVYGPRGLPVISDDKKQGSPKAMMMFLIVPRVVAGAIAYCVFAFGNNALYTRQIASLPENGGYLYVGAFVFSVLVFFLNAYPASMKKPLIMPQNAGNLRANMAIYKVIGKEEMPYVVMEDDGDVGMYNRGNRSLTHFVENAANVIVNFLLGGYVFAFPAFVLIVIFALGRVLHMTGYAGPKGYGAHGPGFGLAMLGGGVLEMLVLIAGIKALQ